MKTIEIPAEPAKQKTIEDYTECDMCKKARGGPGALSGTDWGGDNFDIKTTEINYTTGYSCPDGGSKTDVNFHICSECFDTKLKPWLISQGCEPIIQERDW